MQGYFTSTTGKEIFFRRWMPTSGKVKGVVFMCHGYGGMCWFFGEGKLQAEGNCDEIT